MGKTIAVRTEISPDHQWAINDIYETDQAWEADLLALKDLIPQVSAFEGKLGNDAQTLFDNTQLGEKISLLLDSLANYAQRKNDEDTRVDAYQDMVGRLSSVWVDLAAAGSFETPEVLEIPESTLEEFYKQEPRLLLYKRYFQNIRREKDHILSSKEEKLLAAAGEISQGPDTIFSMFSDADVVFPDAIDEKGEAHPLTQGTFISYLESGDRVLRKSAFDQYYATLKGFSNTLAATLSAQVKRLQFFAKARNYESSLEKSLSQNHVPVAVYHNLIKVVNENQDKMHRYIRLRKKMLGLDELHMYDVYTPLVEGFDEKIPYQQAVEAVRESLKPLGESYLEILDQGFSNRWIDVYENAGKRSGAYSAGARVHPFVLLNYMENLDSQFTLAHEMGHAIHSYLSNKNQPVVYADYVIFVAEVASICNEALLMHHLLEKTTDKKARAYLINHFLDQFKGTLYRQCMFAEFELKMGEINGNGESLTADRLSSEYSKLNETYFGPDMILDQEIAMEWARIPHFYYNYYVFQYATGFAAAIALSKAIITKGAPAVEAYLRFLSAGCSEDPIELLKGAGVDMTTAQPVEDALKIFDSMLSDMEELMR